MIYLRKYWSYILVTWPKTSFHYSLDNYRIWKAEIQKHSVFISGPVWNIYTGSYRNTPFRVISITNGRAFYAIIRRSSSQGLFNFFAITPRPPPFREWGTRPNFNLAFAFPIHDIHHTLVAPSLCLSQSLSLARALFSPLFAHLSLHFKNMLKKGKHTWITN